MNNIFFVLMLSLCSFNCKEKTHQVVINKNIINIIDSIEIEDYDSPIFYSLIFHQRRDSCFLTLTYDVAPPLIETAYSFKGYCKYKSDYVFFFNSISNKFTRRFYNELFLLKDISVLDKFYNRYSIDGKVYTYYIDQNHCYTFVRLQKNKR